MRADITKLKQLEEYPRGDCFRTAFACILKKEHPEEVPNFMKDGADNWRPIFTTWLFTQGYVYVEVHTVDDKLPFTDWPAGPCVVTGKSPRGDFDHAVVGYMTKRGEVFLEWDPSPHHDGTFFDGPIKYVGFLARTALC
jgi:hypothetical protein